MFSDVRDFRLGRWLNIYAGCLGCFLRVVAQVANENIAEGA
jgi:hypothetical protein